MEHELKEEEPGHYSTRQILRAAVRARDLVKEVVSLSRWRQTDLNLASLKILVKEISRFLKNTIPADISIRQVLKVESDTVQGDPAVVHQLLMNICVCVIDYLRDAGGTIEILLENTHSLPEEADDTGIEPFAGLVKLSVRGVPRGGLSTADDRGLELSNMKGLASELNGFISDNECSGEGVCLSAWLPVVAGEQPVVKESAVVTGGKERILFVDDDEQIVEFMQRSLTTLGYHLVGENSGSAAYRTFCNSPDDFDLIISDMNMEGMNGDKLAVEVLKIRPELPFIICTGYNELLAKAKAREIGIRAVIMKPFLMDEMDDLIRMVLRDDSASHFPD